MAVLQSFGAFVQRRQNHYFKFIILILLFLLLAFDRDLAMIYILIMFADWMWFQSDNFISFKISKGTKSFTWFLESLAGLGLFLIISTILVGVFSPQSLAKGGVVAGAQSIFQLLATSTPILKGSKFLTFIGFGILVPIIETVFFNGRLLEGLTTYAENVVGKKISLKTYSVELIVVMFVIASLFTLFHVTSKGLASIPLLITFIFSIISSVLVIRHQELKGAILMHIVTNSAAVASSVGFI